MKVLERDLTTEYLLPATAGQCVAIARMARALGIREEIEQQRMNMKTARLIMWDLRCRLQRRSKE